jgi:hypothetical protein
MNRRAVQYGPPRESFPPSRSRRGCREEGRRAREAPDLSFAEWVAPDLMAEMGCSMSSGRLVYEHSHQAH